MKDYLQDIVQHTTALGIDTVKVVGTGDSTTIEAVSEDKTVILKAAFKKTLPEFAHTFGMPNLGKLNTILNIPEYAKDAKLTIKPRDDGSPDGIHFENKDGDFKNDYRFMSANVIMEKIKSIRATRDFNWQIDITPTVASIQKMKFMISANSEHTTFNTKTEGGKLKFLFGDHSSHGGNFVFQDGVSGTLTKSFNWPVKMVDGIFGLAGDKTMKISDDGVVQIVVDSGIAVYTYMVLAQSK